MSKMTMPSYDEKQIEAREVTWPCCGRTVFSTAPEKGCLVCGYLQALEEVVA